MARIHRFRIGHARTRAGPLPAQPDGRLCQAIRRLPAVYAQHGLPEHDSYRFAARLSGRSFHRKADRSVHSLECHGDGRTGEPGQLGIWRAHLELCVVGNPLRGWLQSLLARANGVRMAATSFSYRATRRPAFTPVRSWRAGSERNSSIAFARKSAAAVCRHIRTHG